MSLKGKIAIVTGGSRGIGAAIAIEIAKRGAQGVLITYAANDAAAMATTAAIESQGAKAHALKADVLDPESGQRTVQAALTAFQSDKVDIYVNNAVVTEFLPFEEISADAYRKCFDASVLSLILAVQAVLPVIQRGGRIINIGTIGAHKPLPASLTLYTSSKAAAEKVVQDLAVEYGAKLGITINNVCPGATNTGKGKTLSAQERELKLLTTKDGIAITPPEILEESRKQATAERRLGEPDDIAQVVAFLAEEGSRWVHGQTITVSGGA